MLLTVPQCSYYKLLCNNVTPKQLPTAALTFPLFSPLPSLSVRSNQKIPQMPVYWDGKKLGHDRGGKIAAVEIANGKKKKTRKRKSYESTK